MIETFKIKIIIYKLIIFLKIKDASISKFYEFF